jgi:biotin operon repressor
MSSEQADTSRAVVQTYVPAYQREEWDDHAEELGMSRSEFVRTMVQAGRRGFGADPAESGTAEDDTADTGATPDASGSTVMDRVVEALNLRGPLSWDELREAVAGDIEAQIEEALGSLQEQGKVRHSGRQGGYVLEGTDE